MKITTSSKQERLKRLFTHNFREKFLAALCAAAALLLSFCFKPVQQTYFLKINSEIAPDQILVSQNASIIEVKAAGTFFDLRRVSLENIEINFDFSAEKAGEISRTVGENQLPSIFKNLKIENIFPETIIWRTEAKIEKTIPVEIVFEEDNSSKNYTAEPAEIRITGAETAVNGLEKIDSEKIPTNTFADKTEIEIPLVFPRFTASADGTAKVKVTKKSESETPAEETETQKNEENSEKKETEE
ncbi:hypothetical protein J6Z19_02895 [bacterium]|nr:hypothetical protein [bacterium]